MSHALAVLGYCAATYVALGAVTAVVLHRVVYLRETRRPAPSDPSGPADISRLMELAVPAPRPPLPVIPAARAPQDAAPPDESGPGPFVL